MAKSSLTVEDSRKKIAMKIVVRWRPLLLWVIALLGLALRLYGLDWDQGNSFHPDERQIMFHVMAIGWPKSFAQFLNAAQSPLNPHFFAYGSFPIYLLAFVGFIMGHIVHSWGSFVPIELAGRVISALCDTGTILLTAWMALLLTPDALPGRPRAWNVALLTAALIAFTPFQLQLSHFYTVDTMMLVFIVLTMLACVKLVDTDRPLRWAFVLGLGYGLAMACKVSAAPLAVPIAVALLLRWYRHDFYSAWSALLVSVTATIFFFVVTQPYFLLDLQNYIQQVAVQGAMARGTYDLPYVRQFAGTVPYLYEAYNLIFWGMGLALGIAACFGLGWLLWRFWRRDIGTWLIVLSWVVVFTAIVGDFYVKYMRYMLPVYPFLSLVAAAWLITLFERTRVLRLRPTLARVWQRVLAVAPVVAIVLVLGGTMFQGLALLNVYSEPNTRVQASEWMYSHIKPGSVITYEQWDDPLPVAVGNDSPAMYNQLVYTDTDGQTTTGLDLYGDDTLAKAHLLAHLLTQLDVITMASDRLDKSIPRLPARYPLTIHYYQLLFSGQLGFHLAAQFVNHPNLLGITLDDSGADESYSVFDHPHVRIFVRDTPFPYTEAQLFQKLMAGVQLPPSEPQLSGAQKSLLLSPQQIADDQQSPPFAVQFPANSLTNAVPPLFWWLVLLALGCFTYPLLFFALPSLADRGYIFSKLLGVLLLAYLAWLLASAHLLPFEQPTILLVFALLALIGIGTVLVQFKQLQEFFRRHWRLLLMEEVLFTLAFLLFVGIRSLDPDLWNPYLGGEKPMELAFLNAILRSPYMPPFDPWFSGGYINYYYYGYVVFAALIKLTGIVPTTAFNLTIPTLFALTFCGAVTIVYTLTRRFSLALLGGYFTALIGNFNGFLQLRGQIQALLTHHPIPAFDYWQSSRVIPFTINEFPFWSFLFSDLHPHVMDMPNSICMLGLLAATLCSPQDRNISRYQRLALYALLAFVFGTIACVNPWDMPVYALLLFVVLLVEYLQTRGQEAWLERLIGLGYRILTALVIALAGYLCYAPFYYWYQELYVNGLGRVTNGSNPGDFLTIAVLWVFIAASFFLVEVYRRWFAAKAHLYAGQWRGWLSSWGYLILCLLAIVAFTILGLKLLLLALLVLGSWLCVLTLLGQAGLLRQSTVPQVKSNTGVANGSAPLPFASSAYLNYTYLLLLMGLGISLGVELVYIRDFLDGGDYERMNTVFKFGIQSWFCFAIGGALAIPLIRRALREYARLIWTILLVALIVCCSIFLVEGPAARIQDHQNWIALQPPTGNANYTPTLDGFAFVRAWYPEDARAIEWLNQHVAGSPVILEAEAPVSYQWFGRVSVYTGLPDVLGWPDHEGEQRYADQIPNRLTDIGLIYTTTDEAQALALLHSYNVRYVYVGPLERQTYGQDGGQGLEKFQRMVGHGLSIVYQADGVTIYEVD
jgi:YYY domain-containing protein